MLYIKLTKKLCTEMRTRTINILKICMFRCRFSLTRKMTQYFTNYRKPHQWENIMSDLNTNCVSCITKLNYETIPRSIITIISYCIEKTMRPLNLQIYNVQFIHIILLAYLPTYLNTMQAPWNRNIKYFHALMKVRKSLTGPIKSEPCHSTTTKSSKYWRSHNHQLRI